MNTFIEDFKNVWNRPNNTLIKLIVFNVIIFVIMILVEIIAKASGGGLYRIVMQGLAMPHEITHFLYRPWTLFTYFFVHDGFFGQIVFNMIGLYWFGQMAQQYLGNNRLLALYIYGGIFGGLVYLAVFNLLPLIYPGLKGDIEAIAPELGMIGAAASVYAVIIGVATLLPDFRVQMLFFGFVPLKYIALVYILLSMLGGAGLNFKLSYFVHFAGVLLGFVMVWQYKKGYDWSKPLSAVIDGVSNLLKPRSRMKVSYKNPKGARPAGGKAAGRTPTQDEVDAILDKISASGYEALTTEEKQILFKASQNKK